MQQRLDEHQRELYQTVIERRNISDFSGFRYPERLPWEQQMHNRNEDGWSFESIYEYIRARGVDVRTQVKWLVPFEEKPGFEGLPDPTQPGVPVENPLLAITVEPTPGNVFPVARYRTPNEPFHCSLAHYWALGPDIYKPGHLMENLLKSFDNKIIHLSLNKETHAKYPNDWGGESWSTGLELDEARDPIATNEWARWAKNKGRFRNRHWHISL